MPKRIFKFQGFYGGINDVFSLRDLSPIQMPSCQDIDISDLGRIKLLGVETSHAMGTQSGERSVQNHGIFYYSTDRVDGAAAADTGEDWIAFSDVGHASNRILKYGRILGTSSLDVIDLDDTGSGAINFEPVYHVVDGVLRVSDGSFLSTVNQTKWHGYIERKHFTQFYGADAFDDWYTKDASIDPPTSGIAGNKTVGTVDDGAGTTTTFSDVANTPWNDSDVTTEMNLGTYFLMDSGAPYAPFLISGVDAPGQVLTTAVNAGSWVGAPGQIYPPAGTGWCLRIIPNVSASGTWPAADYEFASSFVYDGNQESLLYQMPADDLTLSGTGYFQVTVYATGPFNPRITGGRIYTRVVDSDESWELLVDIKIDDDLGTPNVRNGIRPSLTTPWTQGGWAAHGIHKETSIFHYHPSGETYEIINGFSPNVDSISIGADGLGYRFSAVGSNRKVYIAHVKMKSQTDGVAQIQGDLLLKSKANKFDTFLWEDRVEVSVNDGDDITGLVAYADRLLQFKSRKLYIINISQDIEFLEEQHDFRGIEGQWQVCMTEMGPVWFNEHGIFLYNGNKMTDLTEDQKINQKKFDWTSYYTNIEDVSIGYIPEKKQIFIYLNTSGDTAYSDMLIYDIRTQSFVFGYRKLASGVGSSIATNIINDWNNNVVYGVMSTGADYTTFKYWNPAPSQKSEANDFVLFETRMEDFGTPDARKVAYKVTITHNQTAATNADLFLYYRTDEGSWTEVEQFADQSQMAKQEFDFSPYVEDFYEMQFKVAVGPAGAGNIEAAFQIDEISVVVRDKIVA